MLAPLVYALLNQHWLAAAACYVVAVITDIYDGKLARKLNQSSPLGGVLDHLTDALIVTAGCWCLAKLGLINSFLPWIITLAFVQYMLDSKALAGASLKTSRLGRYNGIGYYILLGTGISAYILPWPALSTGVFLAAWLLVATTVISMGDRAIMLNRRKKLNKQIC